MGSGKEKIEIKRVEKEGQRMVTFSKRRHGLFNIARQLRSLTGANIAILIFSPTGRPYTHGKPSFDALVDRYLNTTAAAGEKAEEGCEAAAANHHRLSSWLDALQFDASDSIEDLEILRKGLEEIAAKVAEKIDDGFVDSLLV
ncbi:agamous-like MADS-box protein AGL29 [Camellia sinensis]|uniref:agamous-like MADS-box protein AGL29 n=1 Tax=Camellia sinensis TaxID=4442 RepID=UPI0010361D00|nr:agamous-like MADS-box protein AGL29 [Camellia sinensis]